MEKDGNERKSQRCSFQADVRSYLEGRDFEIPCVGVGLFVRVRKPPDFQRAYAPEGDEGA